MPYFDYLLSEIAQGNSAVESAFGRHVHWGYWTDPGQTQPKDDDFARAAEQLTLELCQLADIADQQNVLDVGCGFGGTLASLNDRYEQLNLVGINIDERQLARARTLISARAENTVEFREGNAIQLPFPDQSFDRLLAVECVFHFPSRKAFFQEARRVLRPGGRLVLSDFIPAPILAPILGPRSGGTGAFGNLDVSFTLGRYQALAYQAGMRVLHVRNVTRHTIPTYCHIHRIMKVRKGSKFDRLLHLQRLLATSGLLRYTLLAFQRP